MSFQSMEQTLQAGHDDDDSGLEHIINEEFLNLPTAQQRAKLHAASGDRRFLKMPDDEVDRYITGAINHLELHANSRGNTDANADNPRLIQALEQAAAANDPEAFNRLMRSASRRSVPKSARGLSRKGSSIPCASTIDPHGVLHCVPHDQLSDAVAAGHTVVMPMTHPDGTHGYIPVEHVQRAHHRGFAMGHKSAGDGLLSNLGNWANEKIEQGIDLIKGDRPAAPLIAAPKAVMPDPEFKMGVPKPTKDSETGDLMQCINQNFQVPFVVTSTSERIKQHPADTPHGRGEAWDATMPREHIADYLQTAADCGAGFALNEYVHPSKNATGGHVHVQTGPGKGGGRGDLPRQSDN